MDPWSVLGLDESASEDEVRDRYRKLVREHHPDRYLAGSLEHAEALRVMPEINAAYEILTKTSARIAHEQTMARRRAMARRAAEAAGERPSNGAKADPVQVRRVMKDDTVADRPSSGRDDDGGQPFDYRRDASSEFDVGAEADPWSVPGQRSRARKVAPPPPVEFFAARSSRPARPAGSPGRSTPEPTQPAAGPVTPSGRLRRWLKGEGT